MPGDARPPLVVITGMSGAGRSTVAKALEDHGWHVVENLPPQLLSELESLRERARPSADGGPSPRLAVVIDSRTRWLAGQGSPLLDQLTGGPSDPCSSSSMRPMKHSCADSSVRRPHPLQGNGRLLDAIAAERAVMADLRSEADVIVDTSGLNVHQLHAKVSSLLDASVGARVRLAVMSFGFKYGIPLDADFVMDMRFLPNPFWVPDLRAMAGTDPAVADYVLGQVDATEFLDRALAMFEPVLAGYAREGVATPRSLSAAQAASTVRWR